MFRLALFTAIVCLTSIASASDIDDVQAAAKKLADTGNYTWKTTNETPGSPQTASVQDGKTEKDGTCWLQTRVGAVDVEFFRRDQKFVFKTPDGWKSAAEINQQSGGMSGIYRSIELNFKPPATMAAGTISKTMAIRKEGDAYTSELTGEEAKKLLMVGGKAKLPYDVKTAKIVSTLWIKDGVIVKDVTRTIATMTVNGEDHDIDRLTTVEFTQIGSTKIDIPAEVTKALE